MTRFVYLLALLAVLAGGGAVTAHAGDHPDNVTLCHASGLEGTTKYETLTVGYPAAFGPAGHFDENGTPNAGHEQDYLGECQTPPPPPPVDYCPTLPGVQAEDEDCPPPPPVDVCPNLEGVQEDVPPGMGIVDGECVPVDINPQCAPPGVVVNGVCIVPPPPPVNPPGVTGNPDVFCDRGAQLYRVSGTIDGQAVDSAAPPTIPGNTRGFTNIILTRGDTQFRTVVFTYGDCSNTPPVITIVPPVVTPPVVTPTPPTVITKVVTKTVTKIKYKTRVVVRHHTKVVKKIVIRKVPGLCPSGTRLYHGTCHAKIKGSG